MTFGTDKMYEIGDSREVIPSLPRNSVDVLLTSPPYNIEYETFNPKLHQYEDTLSEIDYKILLSDVFGKSDRKMREDAQAFVNIKNRYGGRRCRPAFWILDLVPDSWFLRDIIIWKMDIGFDTSKSKFQPLYEHIFWFVKDPEKFVFHPERLTRDGPTNIWYIPIAKGNASEREKIDHPAVFPIELCRRIILMSSEPDHLIFDPFLGSGTTIAVAKYLGRRGFGIELEDKYRSSIEYRLTRQAVSLDRFFSDADAELDLTSST